jgi:hypothetical protein
MGTACGTYGGGERCVGGERAVGGDWAEGKSTLGRHRRRWEDNINMDLQEIGRGCGDWMELAQDRDSWWALVSMVKNLRVP